MSSEVTKPDEAAAPSEPGRPGEPGRSGERTAAVLAALGRAVRSVAGEASLDRVLHQLAASAKELAGARYAAIGVPEPEGDRFAKFVTVGMSDELIEQIGPLPRTHGLLAAMLGDPHPYRTPDITADPRFQWWPSAHPRMRSFLGVPIVSKGDVIGAFYLTDKEGDSETRAGRPTDKDDDSELRSAVGPQRAEATPHPWPTFSEDDEASVALLAAHAAIAIEHARLFEDSRELALAAERARLARELHDAMSQSLFSLRLAAETASSLLAGNPDRAAGELTTVRELAGRIGTELRSVVEGLRPANLERDGLVATLRSQLTLAGRAHGVTVDLEAPTPPELEPEAEHQVLRVVQEAVTNALRHAKANRIDVRLIDDENGFLARIVDDGIGFDPSAPGHRSRRLGLTSMQERADALDGTLTVRSTPGSGTTVALHIPG